MYDAHVAVDLGKGAPTVGVAGALAGSVIVSGLRLGGIGDVQKRDNFER